MPIRTLLMLQRLILRSAAGLCALGLAAGPAAAQIANPLDWLFGKSSSQSQAPAPQPSAPEPAAPARGTTAPRPAQGAPGAMPATAVLPPRRPASLATEQAQTTPAAQAAAAVQAAPGAPRQAPPQAATQPAAQAVVTTATAATAPPPSSEPLNERQIIERANAYFNNISTLVGDFVQTGGDGRRLGGKLYLQRPGKIRFEYDTPATIEVIADGSSVAVRDTRLATQDLYAISQTPLKFLLRPEVNLGRDIRIVGAADEGDAVRLTLEDTSTLGGTSRITLFFDPKVEALTQWRILDPQGFQTTMMLDRVDRSRSHDPQLFAISYDRVLSSNK
jgi:outer membrane lipoprotein-sorting protein